MSNLKEHQAVLLELLVEFDRVCKIMGVKYSLFAGSALGAVRHKGFIPWDDDLDVVMMREDYDKLLKNGSEYFDRDKYFLQKEFSEHWPMFFTKLRKNNTACIERFIPKDKKIHQGIYIDIFPCDNLSDNAIVRKIQFLSSKIVIAKAVDKRGYSTDSKLKKLFMLVCRLLPSIPFVRITEFYSKRNSEMVHTFFGGSSSYSKAIFKRKWIEEALPLEFEGKQYPVSAHYDELLTALYGDYMTPLEEAERGKKVHAELVDVNNSYEKYSDIRDKIEIKEYSRSIR